MSSRRPRSAFAAPLVVTLALAPACIVRTGSSVPPPPQPRGGEQDHRDPDARPPGPIMNPPRPIGGTADVPVTPGRPPHAGGQDTPDQTGQNQQTPPPRQTDGTSDTVDAPDSQLRQWDLYASGDGKSCYARHKADCPPPPATCNPPPPARLKSCPAGATAAKPLAVRELSPDHCFVSYAAPACSPGVSCNPPRPVEIECPAY